MAALLEPQLERQQQPWRCLGGVGDHSGSGDGTDQTPKAPGDSAGCGGCATGHGGPDVDDLSIPLLLSGLLLVRRRRAA